MQVCMTILTGEAIRCGTDLSLDRHMLQEIIRKKLYGLETETLAYWAQVTDQISKRQVSRQLPIARASWHYQNRARSQEV